MYYRTKKIALILGLLLFNLIFTCAALADEPTLGHWAEKQIVDWMDRKLISGYGDGAFKPNQSITRAEFVTLLNRAFGFKERDVVFHKDITPNAWYAEEFAKAVRAGYITGYEDDTMRPNNPLRRQEAAIILAKILNLSLEQKNTTDRFKDAHSIPEWSKGYISALVAEGYLEGYEDHTFRSASYMTRAETIVLLDKAVGKLYNEAGNYGSELKKTIITGNITINSSGVVLNNMEVSGNLYITEGVNQGQIVLNNITVNGRTLIKGHNQLDLVIEGDSKLNLVVMNPNLRVKGDKSQRTGFSHVTILAAPGNSPLQFNGSFRKLSLEADSLNLKLAGGTIIQLDIAKNAIVDLAKNARIELLNALATAEITGQGIISETDLRVNGVIIKDSIRQGDQVFASSSGKKVNDDKTSSGSPVVRVDEIILVPKSLMMESGQAIKLTAIVKPDNATNKKLRWLSSNTKVVTVDRQGKVTALNPGTTTVTALTEDGGKSATCVIEVRESLDPIAELINRINNLEEHTDLKTVLEANADLLGIDLEDYNKLAEASKSLVLQALAANKPNPGYTVESLRIAFGEIVELEKTIEAFLLKVNNAQDVTDLQDLSWLDMMLDNLKELHYYTKRAGKEITVLRKDLENIKLRFNALEARLQQDVLQQLLNARLPGGYEDPFKVCEQSTLAFIEVLTESGVSSQAEMLEALKLPEIETIKISADFQIDESILINRPVNILGNNHTISFTNEPDGWLGNYILKVFGTGDVTIADLKLTEADAAILVNSSEVTLSGKIDVSDNEFGGIKLERKDNKVPSLDVTNAEIQNSEVYGVPTIWVKQDDRAHIQGGNLNQILYGEDIHYYQRSDLSPVTTIRIKAGSDIVLEIDNERKIISNSNRRMANEIRFALESTDGSKQEYYIYPEEGNIPIGTIDVPRERYRLIVIAANGIEDTYTFTLNPLN